MGRFKVAVIEGDGIGPEVCRAACEVLEKTGKIFGHEFEFNKALAGGIAIDETGECLPEATINLCRASDSVLLGAVGGPKWDDLSGEARPETALLGLREELGLYANLRPATIHMALKNACPLKEEIIGDGIDILIVRELTGGIYFGEKGWKGSKNGMKAYDVESYSEAEVKRIAIRAFDSAMNRQKRVVSVDKANVMESSRLWRRVVTEVSHDYPEVELTHMYVDNAAMQLIKDPRQFDVMVTSNIFGDILSDEASMITGSIGLLPSASLGEGSFGMYEPIHGSAPDIAGQNTANPIAAILSSAMMLRHSFGLIEEARCIENAVTKVLESGYRTYDIKDSYKIIKSEEGRESVTSMIMGCKEMGSLITNMIQAENKVFANNTSF